MGRSLKVKEAPISSLYFELYSVQCSFLNAHVKWLLVNFVYWHGVFYMFRMLFMVWWFRRMRMRVQRCMRLRIWQYMRWNAGQISDELIQIRMHIRINSPWISWSFCYRRRINWCRNNAPQNRMVILSLYSGWRMSTGITQYIYWFIEVNRNVREIYFGISHVSISIEMFNKFVDKVARIILSM